MRKLIFLSLFAISVFQINAQIYFEEEADSTSFKDRVYFGGNFSFALGTFTNIDVSPLAGYMVTEDFSVGLGATYAYVSREFILFPGPDRIRVKNSVYGGRGFLRHAIMDGFFAHAEYENLNVELLRNDNSGLTRREWVPGLLIGGGVYREAFKRGGVNLTVLINLLHDDARSPYPNAFVIRGGFTF